MYNNPQQNMCRDESAWEENLKSDEPFFHKESEPWFVVVLLGEIKKTELFSKVHTSSTIVQQFIPGKIKKKVLTWIISHCPWLKH